MKATCLTVTGHLDWHLGGNKSGSMGIRDWNIIFSRETRAKYEAIKVGYQINKSGTAGTCSRESLEGNVHVLSRNLGEFLPCIV